MSLHWNRTIGSGRVRPHPSPPMALAMIGHWEWLAPDTMEGRENNMSLLVVQQMLDMRSDSWSGGGLNL
jgi:hypothetical protein